MSSRRHFLISSLLFIVLVSFFCIDHIRLSKEPAGLSEERRLIDMSIEELMELSVAPAINISIQQMIKGSRNEKVVGLEYIRRHNPGSYFQV